MVKEVISSIEKVKCPLCKRAIKIEAEVKIPQERIFLKPLSPQWFRVNEANYPHADQVYFKNPGPPIPEQHHLFICRDASGADMSPILEGKFIKVQENGREIGKSETIVETGIQELTEANVNSGLWHWEAKYDVTKI